MCEYKVIRVVTADILGQAQLGLLSFRYDALFTVYKFRACDEKSRRTRLPSPLIYSRLRPACIPSISIRTGERFERLRHRQMPRDTYSSSHPLPSTTTGLPAAPLSPMRQGGTRPRPHPMRCPRSCLQGRCLLLPTLFLCGTCLRWVTVFTIGFWLPVLL